MLGHRLDCAEASTETAHRHGGAGASLRNILRAGFHIAYGRELLCRPRSRPAAGQRGAWSGVPRSTLPRYQTLPR
jgi:hypothetical protein